MIFSWCIFEIFEMVNCWSNAASLGSGYFSECILFWRLYVWNWRWSWNGGRPHTLRLNFEGGFCCAMAQPWLRRHLGVGATLVSYWHVGPPGLLSLAQLIESRRFATWTSNLGLKKLVLKICFPVRLTSEQSRAWVMSQGIKLCPWKMAKWNIGCWWDRVNKAV